MKNKPKVLVFIDWYLPGYKAGGPIQSCANLISHLKNDIDFYVVTRNTDYCEDIPYREIESDKWNKFSDSTHIYYISKAQLNRNTIKNIIDSREFDYCYINGIFSYYFSILPLRLIKEKSKIIIASRGMFAPSALKVKWLKKKIYLLIAKWCNYFKGVSFHATNLSEQKQIKAILGEKTNVKVADNLPSQSSANISLRNEKVPDSIRIVNIARIAPEKNLKYALEILNAINDVNIVFDIYGPIYNESYWRECVGIIKNFSSNIVCTYKGAIPPSEVSSILTQYDIMFMPTRGENFGHIILQSFLSGTPVLISNQTPWVDLRSKNIGADISLNKKDEFQKYIYDISKLDNTQFLKISSSSLAFGQSYINNKSIVEQNKKLFNLK